MEYTLRIGIFCFQWHVVKDKKQKVVYGIIASE